MSKYELPEKLVWVDLETTGLNPSVDAIVEVGIVVTDANLVTIAEWSAVRGYHQRLNDEVLLKNWFGHTLEMHTANGLAAEFLDSHKSLSCLQSEAIAFLEGLGVVPGSSPMCGSSVAFDRAFLKNDMPDLEMLFHYRNLDATSIITFAQMVGPIVLPEREGAHRALPDIRRSIEIVRACREQMRVGR